MVRHSKPTIRSSTAIKAEYERPRALVTGATGYFLWVNDSSGNVIQQVYTAVQANCDAGQLSCYVTPATSLADGNSKWWVQASNIAGAGPWSSLMTFNVGSVPAATTLNQPTGTITSNMPTYDWDSVQGATSYLLWVNDSTGNVIQQVYTAAQASCDTGQQNCSVTSTIFPMVLDIA